ncbi:hypothetical protein FN846DRAFT_977700 [Sphaerosporella brunnea]|uniref:Small acidic protein n=1 Tax=Sphaerosporella brunnea TaxID=1250544 RepID=A0A5J5EEC8_9PEZI|nr:hypothetical protein FN846DRAFT_977700 [Sphaerosporella brunnea]
MNLQEAPSAKKLKSSKYTDGPESTQDSKKTETAAAAKWNAAELAGGDARQSKFMRLLGAGKLAAAPLKPNDAGSSIKVRERELEKQFNAGLKMAHEPNSKRRGLGA